MATDYSAYTVAQLLTAYRQNATYVRDRSTTKAAELVAIGEQLLVVLPSSSARGSGNVSFGANLPAIQAAVERAQLWLEARSADDRVGPDVTIMDLGTYR